MVADTLIYHPSVGHYLRFVATTIGRDKLMRVVQYFSRFYAWYLYRLNGSPSEIAPWEAAKKQLALVRKALRLGKWVEHLKAAAQAFDSPAATSSSSAVGGVGATGGGMDPFLRYCAIGRQLGYAGYHAMDNVAFVDQSGIKKLQSGKRAQQLAYRSWFIGLTFNIIAGLYTLNRLRREESEVDRKEGEGAVNGKKMEKERQGVRIQLVSDLCDIVVPTFGLGWGGEWLDDGLVGLLGVVSSSLGVQAAWAKTA